MANVNRERLPPPPPPGIGVPAPPGMVQGGPANRPQQAQQPRQYPAAHQQSYQQAGQAAYPADTFINGSTRIHDIRPEKTETESFCRKQLTSYEVYTILPGTEEDGKDSKGTKDSKDKKKDNWAGWGGKDNDKDESKTPKKRERWARVQINQESYPTEQIIKTIRKLDAGRLSITEKKARLFPNQSTQVTNILDSKIMNERESQSYEWVLAQLHREEATNSKTGKKETTSMTIYLKRSPLPGIDVAHLYRERQERARMQAAQRQAQIIHQQQQQQHAMAMQQQQQQLQMQMQQQQMQQQMGGGQYHGKQGVYHEQNEKGETWRKGEKQNKDKAPAGVKIVQDHRPGTPAKGKKGGKAAGVKIAGSKVRTMDDSDSFSSDSFSESDSDSEFSHSYDSDTTPRTSNSSHDGRKRKNSRSRRPLERSRERRRVTYPDRGEDFVIIDHPRRHSVSYAPDVPHLGRPAGSRVHSYGQPRSVVGEPSMSGGLDASTSEGIALGIAAAARAFATMNPVVVQAPMQYAPAPQRMITNSDRAIDDSSRLRVEQRRFDAEEIMRQDALREAVSRQNAMRPVRPYDKRDLLRERELLREMELRPERLLDPDREVYAPSPRRYVDDERVSYREPQLSPSVSSASSAAPISPRERTGRWSPGLGRRSPEHDYRLRGAPHRSPLDDREYEYSRNPFQRRREPRSLGYRY